MQNCTCLIGSQYNHKKDEMFSKEYIFRLNNSENDFIVQGCSFEKPQNIDREISRVKESQLRLFGVCANFDHCTFRNINEPIEELPKINQTFNERYFIQYCTFEKCSNMIQAHGNLDIEYCSFNNGYGYVCTNNFSTTIYIGYCKFYNLAYGDGGYKNSFETQETQSILYFYANKSSSHRIEKCQFDHILLAQGYLTEQNLLYKKDLPINVEECTFENCFTNREDKKILKEYDRVYGKLRNKGKSMLAINIRDCKGLDQVKNLES